MTGDGLAYPALEVDAMETPIVDQDVCTGCELCTDIAANTFRMNADGVSEVFNPQGDDEQTIQEAMDSCPVSCISWGEA
jgi:ferredoxin